MIAGVGEDDEDLKLAGEDLGFIQGIHLRAGLGDNRHFGEVIFNGWSITRSNQDPRVIRTQPFFIFSLELIQANKWRVMYFSMLGSNDTGYFGNIVWRTTI